jgi:DNA-binding MarR family transcriptional regulator
LKSLGNSIGRWISILYRYRKCYVNRRLEPYGIAGGQYIFLLTLNGHDGMSQEQVSDYLKMDKTTTAKAIKKLEENGYVERNTNSEDKRAYNVFLTQKARDVMPLIHDAVEKWENTLITGISEDEYQLLETLLSKMAENAYSANMDDQVKQSET